MAQLLGSLHVNTNHSPSLPRSSPEPVPEAAPQPLDHNSLSAGQSKPLSCQQVPGPKCTWDQEGSLAGYLMRLSLLLHQRANLLFAALPSPSLGAIVTDCAYGKCNSISNSARSFSYLLLITKSTVA